MKTQQLFLEVRTAETPGQSCYTMQGVIAIDWRVSIKSQMRKLLVSFRDNRTSRELCNYCKPSANWLKHDRALIRRPVIVASIGWSVLWSHEDLMTCTVTLILLFLAGALFVLVRNFCCHCSPRHVDLHCVILSAVLLVSSGPAFVGYVLLTIRYTYIRYGDLIFICLYIRELNSALAS